jgi:hypothetical protein
VKGHDALAKICKRVPKRRCNHVAGFVADVLAWQMHWLLGCTLKMWSIARCLSTIRQRLSLHVLDIQSYIEDYSSFLMRMAQGYPGSCVQAMCCLTACATIASARVVEAEPPLSPCILHLCFVTQFF